ELPADLPDVDINRSRLPWEVRAPHALEQGVPAEDDAGVAGQRGEEVELASPQLQAPVRDGGLAPAGIDPQRADLDRPATAGGDACPPQDRLHPGDERPRVERLGDVVVRAEL